MDDITRYGTGGLNGIRTNAAGDEELSPARKAMREEAARAFHNRKYVGSRYNTGPVEDIGLDLEQVGYGESRYDKGITFSQLDNLDDWRATKQSSLEKLGAGILKGIGLAGTTLLDGTIGLVYGIGQMAATGDVSMLFNNDLSKAFREFNNYMEDALPNYRTKDEIENPWALRNIFSINTFADDFLKNMGFTVGAFYSGNAYLSALRALGATGMSTTAAKTLGSFLSGFSEGRIEAGNLYDEQMTANKQILEADKQRILQEVLNRPEYIQTGQQLTEEYEAKRKTIEAGPDNFVQGPDGRMRSVKAAALEQLYNQYSTSLKQLEGQAMQEVNARTKQVERDMEDRATKAALSDLVFNTLYLPFTDAYAYGKLYGRKFNVKSELAGGVKQGGKKAIDQAAEKEIIDETLGKRVVRQGKEFVTNPISRKKAATKGLKIGISEGAEEMNQAWFSSTSTHWFEPDSPDAYYNALNNEDYEIQTKDFLTAATEGFMDSWGSSSTYKEGLVGFLTGLIGMPTFGRVNNSDSNTYLGKGKMIGLSGGIFGEISNSNRLNQEADAAVKTMNTLVNKITDAESFFIRAKSFTDATDGFSEANDKFEFNNAADNELFHAIDAFSRTGRLQDLKDIINEDIENATQEQLEDIARNVTGDSNEFKNVDGSDMASTEDGQKQMKDIIRQRQEEISKGIDSYEKALEKTRRIANNSLNADQVAELAWLQWKMDKFSDRFESVKKKDFDRLSELQGAISAFKKGRGIGMVDTESEAGQNILKSLDTVQAFIQMLLESKTPLQFGALIKASGNTRDWIKHLGYPMLEDMVGFNAEEFGDLMTDLNDAVKIAEAAKSFNDRYKEFKADPTKLIKNRDKINKKKSAEQEVKNNAEFKTALDNMSVSEIAEKLRNKEISEDQIKSIEDTEKKAPREPDVDLTAAQKLDEAEKINKARERAINALQQQMDQAEGGVEAIEDAIRQIEESASSAESIDDFFDTSTRAFVDNQVLTPDEPGELTPEEEALLDERRDAATAINQGILDRVKKDMDAANDMPEPPTPDTEPEETGHDATTKANSVPQTEDNKDKAEKKEEPKRDYSGEAADLLRSIGIVAPSKTQVSAMATILDTFNKLTALNGNALQSIARCRNLTDYRTLGRQIDARYDDGIPNVRDAKSPLIDNILLGYSNQPASPTTTPQQSTNNESDVTTPTISRATIEGQETAESKRSFDKFPDGPINYWKSTITEYPIHDNNRENITYAEKLLNETTEEVIKLLPQVSDSNKAELRRNIHDVIKELLTKPLNQVQNSNSYKLAQLLVDANKLDNVLQMLLDDKVAKVDLQRLRRTVAVTEYLKNQVGAFDKVDTGKVYKGYQIKFKTDKRLNEQAGEMVILIEATDDNGNSFIIGDLMSKNEPVASRQIGLLPYIELCEKELAKNTTDNVVTLPGTSKVRQLMVGRPAYTSVTDRPTLNSVFGGQQFRLGVALTAGKNAVIKSDDSPLSSGQSDEDRAIWSPLNAIKGQPYLLLPTGNADKGHVCVPFLMPTYNRNLDNTAFGQAIKDTLSRIGNAPTQKNAIEVKDDMLDLLSLKTMWIKYNGDNVEVSITRPGETRQTTIYSGPIGGNMVDSIMNGLQGVAFRVNRKFINGTYNGRDYNFMVGEIATCNLVPGITNTVNNWFTIDRVELGKNGEVTTKKADRIPTLGSNPNAKNNSGSTNTSGMYTVFNSLVDPDTFEVYELDGKTPFKTDNPTAILVRKAEAFGRKTDKDMTQPYDTEWGTYDPVKHKFVSQPIAERPETPELERQEEDNTVPQTNETPIQTDAKSLEEEAKAKGYLRTPRRKNVWEALTTAQKNALLAFSKLKGEQTMKTLESPAYFDNNKKEFKQDITSLLGGFKLRKVSKPKTIVWNEQQERRWLAKVLPNLNQAERLRVVDAAIKVGNEKNPITAWGMFQNGIITIWDKAARGTLYHEAFHAVTDLLLTDDERVSMFNAARKLYGNLEPIALEEKLAEDFRKYVQREEKPVIGRLIRIFRTLKHIIQNLLGKEPYLNTLFYKINRGEFANREPKVIKSNIVVNQNITNTKYRLNDSKEETLRRETQRFLDNFGITLQEVEEYPGEDLFDDLNRIIYYKSVEDITDGAGIAIAFMMQKQRVMTDMISLYNNFGNNTKGLKRGLKSAIKNVAKETDEEKKKQNDFRIPSQKKDENIAEALQYIGKEISKELRKLYGFGEQKPSFLERVWQVIAEFFNRLTPQTRMTFDVIKHQTTHIANSVKLNDKTLIVKGMVKPKTDSIATRVDVAQALRENPYEERIIAFLSTKGIALAGSASIALNGTLYRPKENPLHDIDFQASQYNKESLDKIVAEISPYWMHTNTITKEGEGSTETYMVLDRDFTIEPYKLPRKDKEGNIIKGKNEEVALLRDKNTKELLGYRIGSELILKDGVKGKMLDFFTGTNSNPYGYHSMNLNDKNYLISDPRNAFAAKVKWLRLKDLWDYNRYVPNDRMINTDEQSDREVARRVKEAKIIWGHPAIGKTTYIEKHRDEILEWDEEINPKRDAFIYSQVDPDNSLPEDERRQRKRDYMRDWKDHPEYIAFLTREWEALKDRAKKEGKQIFASPTPLLNLFMDDFDLFLNLTEQAFMERNQARNAGGYYSSLGWKQAINDALVRVNPDKLVTTDKYFSQIMGDDSMTPIESTSSSPTTNTESIHSTLSRIRSFYINELAYGNLNQEKLDYLTERGITKEMYNQMTMLERDTLFECMF